jgi:putative membrane protein insertion efficiency factor
MKQTITRTTIILCLNSISLLGAAQSSAEIAQMRRVLPAVVQQPPAYKQYARNNRNELHLLLSMSFLGYKTFISSQDGNKCNFAPSCSEYAVLAIKKHGVIIGGLATFDRLTRCNGLSPELYPNVTPKTKRLIDNP